MNGGRTVIPSYPHAVSRLKQEGDRVVLGSPEVRPNNWWDVQLSCRLLA